jgi:SAM-dependent methyltransferase
VLEHVSDDGKAVAEIARILRPGGLAILQTPYSPTLEGTWEDRGIATPEGRLQAYGQADHVRLFGRDIFERIASGGLESRVRTHEELLPHVVGPQAGVNPQEPFFLFQTPGG